MRKRWWLIAWIWVMIVILLVRENNDSFAYVIAAALVLLQGIIAYQYWGYANSKENASYLQDRHYEIDSDKIVGITVDGTSTSIEVRNFISVMKTSNYYLLYTTKTEYIYLPINSFKSTEDKEWFDREIIAKIKK